MAELAAEELHEVQRSLMTMTRLQADFEARSPQRWVLMRSVHVHLTQRLSRSANLLAFRHLSPPRIHSDNQSPERNMRHAVVADYYLSPQHHSGAHASQLQAAKFQQEALGFLAVEQARDELHEVQRISAGMRSVRALLDEVHLLTTMQGEQVEHIVGNLERARRHVHGGHREVQRRLDKERINTVLLASLTVPAIVLVVYVVKILQS
jgi:hypothetical protein